MLAEQHGPGQVDGQDIVPNRAVDGGAIAVPRGDADIVVQNVDFPEAVHGRLDQRPAVIFLSHIGAQAMGSIALFFDQRPGLVQ